MEAISGILTIFGFMFIIWLIGFTIVHTKKNMRAEERAKLLGVAWAKASIEDATDWIGGWPQFDGAAIISRVLAQNLRNASLEKNPTTEELRKYKLNFSKEERPAENAVSFLWNLFSEALEKLSGEEEELKAIHLLLSDSSARFMQSKKWMDYTRCLSAGTILMYCKLVGILKDVKPTNKRYQVSDCIKEFEKSFALNRRW